MTESRKPPVFIVGSPRSGTTLLQRILNRHPGLAVCSESRFFEEVYPQRSAFGSLENPANRERLVHELLLTARIRQMGSNTEMLRQWILEKGTSWGNVFLGIMQFYAACQGKPRGGDKTPVHSYFTETLSEWYPGAPIVHLMRDPRDVVASLRHQTWGPKSTVNSAYFWVRFNQAAERSRHRREYLLVHYEKLIEDPQRELARICDHIDEPFSDALLLPESSGPYQWPVSAAGAVTKERLGKWREQLTAEEVSIVEWIAGARLETYGYSRQGAPLSAGAKTKALMQSAIDLARRRSERIPQWWLRLTQPANLAAHEYCRFRHYWDLQFTGIEPLHLRRDETGAT